MTQPPAPPMRGAAYYNRILQPKFPPFRHGMIIPACRGSVAGVQAKQMIQYALEIGLAERLGQNRL